MKALRLVSTAFAAVALTLGSASAFAVQPAQQSLVKVKPSASQILNASKSINRFAHARVASHVGAAARPALEQRSTAAQGASGKGEGDGLQSGPRFPPDLTYQGGPVITKLTSHNSYVDTLQVCADLTTCWGNPTGFLADLGRSDFVHVIDQFVSAYYDNRYTVDPVGLAYTVDSTGAPAVTPYYGVPPSTAGFTSPVVMTDLDIEILALTAADITGKDGYEHQFHIFLAPGTDLCFDNSYTQCYSPDNYKTFYFCAYHGSFDTTDGRHILYSAEPYANTPGCQDTGSAPNGALTDSTNNTLSHELFETITDPDGNGWRNLTSNAMYGQEIGDECSFINATGFDPSVFTVEDKVYAAQPEYSNREHACIVSP